MKKILLAGSKGHLGSEIKELASKYPEYTFFFTDIEELDICNKEAAEGYVVSNNIEAISNCAAYTAADKAESEISMVNEVNHLAIEYFANIEKSKGIRLIHISSDYVFDGNSYKPYTETDIPNPQSVYGRTKLNAELAMQRITRPILLS